MRVAVRGVLVVSLLAAVSACKEEGTILVHKLTFNGVHAVDAGRLQLSYSNALM